MSRLAVDRSLTGQPRTCFVLGRQGRAAFFSMLATPETSTTASGRYHIPADGSSTFSSPYIGTKTTLTGEQTSTQQSLELNSIPHIGLASILYLYLGNIVSAFLTLIGSLLNLGPQLHDTHFCTSLVLPFNTFTRKQIIDLSRPGRQASTRA